jgi:hypothetical protein
MKKKFATEFLIQIILHSTCLFFVLYVVGHLFHVFDDKFICVHRQRHTRSKVSSSWCTKKDIVDALAWQQAKFYFLLFLWTQSQWKRDFYERKDHSQLTISSQCSWQSLFSSSFMLDFCVDLWRQHYNAHSLIMLWK